MNITTTLSSQRTKRSYNKPSAITWAEITELYSRGGLTLPEIARRYGVSVRAIQVHVAKGRSAIVPSSPPSVPPMGTLALSAAKLTEATHLACIAETKASAYNDAVALQSLIGKALAALASDPSIPATAVIRAADQAAVALERTHKVRRLTLGMGKEDDAAERPLPELPIRELTRAEVASIRGQQANEDAAYEADASHPDAGDDGFVNEGE